MVASLSTAILLFENVEVLDFAGPFEVFSRTRLNPGLASRRSGEPGPFDVFTVSRHGEALTATGGLRVVPDHSFASAPPAELLVVPGGFGTRALLEDGETLGWIAETSRGARHTASVCTGSLLLAKAGLLAGKRATTHWGALDQLAEIDPSLTVERDARFVQDGIVTSAGVAAGIDMSFAVVAQLFGREVAEETARYIDYPLELGVV